MFTTSHPATAQQVSFALVQPLLLLLGSQAASVIQYDRHDPNVVEWNT